MAEKSANILNAVRNVSSAAYRNAVPEAIVDAPNYRDIGNAIFSNQMFINEYLSGFITQICLPVSANMAYSNPWSDCIKEGEPYGGGIEEYYIEPAKPMQYDPELAETTFAKRELPPTKLAYHVLNSQLFFKRTLQEDAMREAFCTADGIAKWADDVIMSVRTGDLFAEKTAIKYCLLYGIISNTMARNITGPLTAATSNDVLSAIKEVAKSFNDFTPNYNEAGVLQYTDTPYLYVFSTAKFDAIIDVNSLAAAFNLEYAKFLGRRFSCASFQFSPQEIEYLGLMFGNAPNYIPITDAINAQLANVQAIAIDSRYLQIYRKLYSAGDFRVFQGLYTNYMLHDWKIYSTSPFQNAVAFISAEQSASAIAVAPATATVTKNSSTQFTATVTASGDGVAPQVVWTVTGGTNSYITKTGLLTVGSGETATTLTVTAVAGAKSATATVTVS